MAEEQVTEVAEPKKKLPIKTLMVIVVVLLLEMVTAIVAYMMAGGPDETMADRQGAALVDDGTAPVEQLVVEERFANSKQGAVYLYDTQIYIQIQKKHQPKAEEMLKNMSATISADIHTIFRRAEPSYMHEDALQTLTRQIKEVLDKHLVDEEKKSMVQKVLITRCTEYRADY